MSDGVHCYDCRHFDPSEEAAPKDADHPNEWGWCRHERHFTRVLGVSPEKSNRPQQVHKEDWCKDLDVSIDLVGQLRQRQKWAKINIGYHDPNESYHKGMMDAYDCSLLLAERQQLHLKQVIQTLEKLS